MVFTKTRVRERFSETCPVIELVLEAANKSSLASNLRRHRSSCGATNRGSFCHILCRDINIMS